LHAALPESSAAIARVIRHELIRRFSCLIPPTMYITWYVDCIIDLPMLWFCKLVELSLKTGTNSTLPLEPISKKNRGGNQQHAMNELRMITRDVCQNDGTSGAAAE
jgi:hypothetical protein